MEENFTRNATHFPEISDGAKYISLSITILLMVTGGLGHSATLVVFIRKRAFKTVFECLIFTMSAVHVYDCTLVIPFFIAAIAKRDWYRRSPVCLYVFYATFLANSVVALLLLAISVTRHLHVVHHRLHLKKETLVTISLIAVFGIPSIVTSISFLGGFPAYSDSRMTCRSDYSPWRIAFFTIIIGPTVILPPLLYMHIHWVIRKSHMRVQDATTLNVGDNSSRTLATSSTNVRPHKANKVDPGFPSHSNSLVCSTSDHQRQGSRVLSQHNATGITWQQDVEDSGQGEVRKGANESRKATGAKTCSCNRTCVTERVPLRDARLTKMIIVLFLGYLVYYLLPGFMPLILESWVYNVTDLYVVSQRLFSASAAINFVIFVAMNRTLRRDLRNIFKPRQMFFNGHRVP